MDSYFLGITLICL